MKLLLSSTIAILTIALGACASTASSIWNSDGDIVLSPADNRSVVTTGPIMVAGARVYTEAEVHDLLAPVVARLASLERLLLGECAAQRCLNGGTCSVADALLHCACPSGFTGALCELVDACASSPCYNGATCANSASGEFECVCTSDFMGSNCERGTAFVTVWQTTSDASTITLPLMDSGTYNCTVEWGDASAPDTLTSHTAPKRTHTYALAGTYTVTIRGTFVGLRFANAGDKERLIDIKQWGKAQVGQHVEGGYFHGCVNMVVTATDPLDLTGTVSLTSMFRNTAIDSRGNLSLWNTQNVTDMSQMFRFATELNQSLKFDTSSVLNMFDMFHHATAFNQLLSFDTRRVTDMSGMFSEATNFNQPLNFDTSSVTTFSGMFNSATSFNQSLNSFDTTSATDLSGMFAVAHSFNHPLNFITSNVIDMNSMFESAFAFNQPLAFNTSKVTDMSAMFHSAIEFNQPISFTDTSSVANMRSMFQDTRKFNQPLNFNTSSVVNMVSMFAVAESFNQDLSHWCVPLLSSTPVNFDLSATAWILPHPVWGSCP